VAQAHPEGLLQDLADAQAPALLQQTSASKDMVTGDRFALKPDTDEHSNLASRSATHKRMDFAQSIAREECIDFA